MHRPPPDDIRDALAHRVIPIVEDEKALMSDRIQAIRELGRTGYAMGADALIDLLDRGETTLSREVVWSLESISGMALGTTSPGGRTGSMVFRVRPPMSCISRSGFPA